MEVLGNDEAEQLPKSMISQLIISYPVELLLGIASIHPFGLSRY